MHHIYTLTVEGLAIISSKILVAKEFDVQEIFIVLYRDIPKESKV